MLLTAGMCVYSDAPYIIRNLRHHYPYYDKFIIVYSAFQDFVEIRKILGLPEEDGTLDLLHDFARNEDPDEKVEVLVPFPGTIKNFTEARKAWLEECDTTWFTTLDADEFHYSDQLLTLREMLEHPLANHFNMFYVDRITLVGDFFHYWDNKFRPYVHGDIPAPLSGENKKYAGRTQVFGNGMFIFPPTGFDLLSVGAYRNHIGEWIQNSIDSFYVHKGTRHAIFSNNQKTAYVGNKIRYLHYHTCMDPVERRARALYYARVRGLDWRGSAESTDTSKLSHWDLIAAGPPGTQMKLLPRESHHEIIEPLLVHHPDLDVLLDQYGQDCQEIIDREKKRFLERSE